MSSKIRASFEALIFGGLGFVGTKNDLYHLSHFEYR
jgi:hypothetical protein